MESITKRFRSAETAFRIPEDVIIEEILSRLPVKSLLRFKCVSKSWYFLISSKQFIKIHLEKSKRKRIVTTVWKPSWRLKHYSLPSFSCGEQVNYALSSDLQIDNLKDLRFVGSCDGLVCILTDRKYFMLWNPPTRESKKLPQFFVGDKHLYDDFISRRGYFSIFGFVSDESSHDYKIYARFCMVYVSLAKVYSLKTGSWKHFGYLEHNLSTTDMMSQLIQSSSVGTLGKFASGKLHWYIKSHPGQSMAIHSFELKRGVKQVVKQPNNIEGRSLSRLGVLDGCLCMQCYYDKNRLDFWVCNEYGVEDSWVKRFTISCQSHPLIAPTSVFFLNNSDFLVYNPKENRLWYPQTAASEEFHEAALYVESLVSLVLDREQERRELMMMMNGKTKRCLWNLRRIFRFMFSWAKEFFY